jgi:glycosyltransferase involved in cell wall biosynthesis
MINKIDRKFSLIVSTFDRKDVLERFLASLIEQKYKNYELILVDLNKDNRLSDLLIKYQPKLSQLKIVKHSFVGLAEARNIGMQQASGEIIAFPDDDCWYAADVLEFVNNFLGNNPEIEVLSGRIVDPAGREVAGRFIKQSRMVNKFNVWRAAASVTLFIKSELIKRVGDFDEKLGPGSGTKFLASEETDYALRLLEAGARVHYDHRLLVYHPDPVRVFNDQTIRRAFEYGCGAGRVIKKHHYPLWFKLNVLLRPFAAAFAWLLLARFMRSRFYFASLTGRIVGLFSPL